MLPAAAIAEAALKLLQCRASHLNGSIWHYNSKRVLIGTPAGMHGIAKCILEFTEADGYPIDCQSRLENPTCKVSALQSSSWLQKQYKTLLVAEQDSRAFAGSRPRTVSSKSSLSTLSCPSPVHARSQELAFLATSSCRYRQLRLLRPTDTDIRT